MTVAAFGLLTAIVLNPTNSRAETSVGTAAAVNVDAFGTPPGQLRQVKLIGDNVVFNERIETTGSGLVQVLLNDGSTFTVGANSDLVIDEFVYDPNAGSGKLVATLGKGVVRFVGGKLSKKKGGVSVKTPVGTIGIRGGIANLNLNGNDPVFSLLFGDELSFSGTNGANQRIYRPGYSLAVNYNAGGSSVRRTTQNDLANVQQGLSSGGGQIGGIQNPPNENQVANSGVPGVNSNLGSVRTAPVRKPRVNQGTEFRQIGPKLLQTQRTTQQRTLNRINQEEETIDVRILTAGSTFAPTWDNSRVVASPGAQGLIGGSNGVNNEVSFSFGSVSSGTARAVITAEIENSDVYQFSFSGDGQYFYSQTYTDQDYVRQSGDGSIVPVAPTVNTATDGNVTSYAWGAQYYHENFLAFAHLPDVTPGGTEPFDIEKMIVGIAGTGTNFSNYGDNSGTLEVRNYDLSSDPTLMFSLGSNGAGGSFTPVTSDALFINPLVAKELGVTFMNAIDSTGLKLIEESSSTLNGGHFLANSFHIEGTGTSQKSFISLAVGNVYLQDSDGYGVMSTGRRGGHRIATDQTAGLYGGPVGTVAGPDGGQFFGTNAQSFVFGNVMRGSVLDDPYGDNYVDRPGVFQNTDTLSASLHVGRLDGSSNVNSLTRTDRTLNGYAAGVLESTINYSVYSDGPIAFSSTGPSDLAVTFDSSAHSLGGALTVRDVNDDDQDVDAYTVRFGFNNDTSGTQRAAFIDDDTYAARDASNRSETFLTTDTPQTLQHDPDENPNTYFIPSTLVSGADDAIMAGVTTKCTCDFLEWGYWGTQLSYDESGGELPASATKRQDAFHLGTWVAGDVTNSANLPTSGSATYTGHAAGNVINGSDQYLAAGNFSMNIDFSTRAGAASISNFDGRTFSATNLTEQAIASGNLFSGTLSGGVTSGTLNTSIVGGPSTNHDGVIGNFSAVDGTWSATGIVAGKTP